jgi:class 3 adenylate cyclase/tetratricopeptide (TPR) repeat protein
MNNLIPHLIHQQFVRQKYRGQLHAATMFVDVSGFTSLTETLMTHQKDGAEVLTEVLNQVFQPIVGQVYAQGGFISTFAGDAFTALFPVRRRDAAQHAVQAAFFIQQFFAHHGLVRTRYGDFVLGVRIGLGGGPVRWGILGQAGLYTYFFRGPGIEACIRAEDRAAAGEVIAEPDLLPLFSAPVYAIPLGAHFRLSPSSRQVPPRPAARLSLTRTDLNPFILNEVVDLSAPAEFRDVACVFISFDQPRTRPALNAFTAQVLEEALRFGGYFNKLDFGDKGPVMLIVFGAPLAHEDDLARAADFLLALQERTRIVRWRAGLTLGTVYAGFIGAEERGEYTVIGDVINLSSRLMQRAEWGEVWLSAAAAKRLQATHEVQPLGEFVFKGKRKPIAVCCLNCRKATTETPLHTGPMVGRRDELAQLMEFAQPIYEGRQAGLAVIYGEAGVGKSRLAYELQQHLAPTPMPPSLSSMERGRGVAEGQGMGVRWFLTDTDPILRRAFYPFSHLLRGYFDQGPEETPAANLARFERCLDSLLAELKGQEGTAGLCEELLRARSILGALVGLHWPGSPYEMLDAKGRYENTLLAIRTFLLAESLLQPVVLQLEDGQWLDDASRQALNVLTRDSAGFPVLVLVTSRYADDGSSPSFDGAPEAPALAIHLGVLSPDDIRALAQDYLGGAISPALHRLLLNRTQANPFFAQQLLAYFRESDLLALHQGAWQVATTLASDLPASINAVLVARIDRLPAATRDVVKAASVLGREFETRVLEYIVGADVGPAVQDATTAQIWAAQSDVRYTFRHTLLRDAAYGMQLRARLRELHRAAAGAIETLHAADLGSYYAELAYHYGQAADAGRELHYAILAGDGAVQVSAFHDALGFFERALALLPADRLEQHIALDLKLGETHVQLGNYSAAQEYLYRAQDLGEQQGDAAGEANALYHLSVAAHRQGDYTLAQTLLNGALPLARAAGDQETLARVLFGLGGIAWRVNRMAESWSDLEESLALARALGKNALVLTILNNLGTVAVLQERLDVAQRLFEECRTLALAVGDRSFAATTSNNLGEVAGMQGDFRARKEYILAALEIYRQTGQQDNIAMTLLNLSETYLKTGESAQAERALHEGLALAHRMGAVPVVLAGLTILARLRAVQGRPDHALALLGLVRGHPAANSDIQRVVAETIADLGLDEARVRSGLAAGEKLVLADVVAETLAS